MIQTDPLFPAFVPHAAARGGGRIERLLTEIEALVDSDETAERHVTGAWRTFDEITTASNVNAWDAYSIDLTVDAESYRGLDRNGRNAILRIFATIYRAESVVDEWMSRVVAAIPVGGDGTRGPMGYDALRTALKGQEHDEKMHRGSLVRVATEVFGLAPGDVERVARRYSNFVAEAMFRRFNSEMARLLRPNRPLGDVHTAIFIYGVLSEDVVANSDVVIRRAQGNDRYAEYDLPGMREGQTHVRRDEGRHVRIAVLASHKFIKEHETAAPALVAVCTDYLDLADLLLRRAKRSRGLIDAHLRESYGPDVDSLYYYLVNMKRLAVRADELGLRDTVHEIGSRVARAVAEFTDQEHNIVVEEPGYLARMLGARTLSFSRRARN